MKQDKKIIWSDEFLSGCDVIDNYHKKIVDSVNKLYEMLEDAGKYKDELAGATKELEKEMLEHMDLEIEFLKKFSLPYEAHEASHKYYKDKYEFYKNYEMNDIIRALFTSEITGDYMKLHFFQFDIHDMPLIRNRLDRMKNH